MKARKYLIISFTFISVFLIFSNFTIHADEIIETKEVYKDGSMFIKLETPYSTITMKYFINSGYENDTEFYTSNGSGTTLFSEDDYFYDNIWMPDEFGGVLPQDVSYNSMNNKVYLYGGRRLVIIDSNTNSIINSLTVSDVANITYGSNLYSLLPEKRLAYNSLNNKLYCATDAGELVIIDGETDQIICTLDIQNQISDMTFCDAVNKIYILRTSGITIIDGDQDIITNSLYIEGLTLSKLIFNPINNRVYVHALYSNTLESRVYAIDCYTEEICSVIGLEQKVKPGAVVTRYACRSMIFNSANNQIVCANKGFSNVSVIQCYSEEKVLHPGWNWESFPRLMRVGNNPVDAVSVLENIDPFPTEIQFLGENGYLEYSLEYGWDFTGELYDIVSTSGYKLWTDNTVDSNLPTPGSRVALDTPITLIASDYSYQLNWIGYWLPQTQMSDVAFGDEWNNVWSIKAEDYYYHDGSMEYKNGTSPTYPWGPIPMEYGKGYLVRVHNTITDFQWNNSGDNISVPEKSESQYFSYSDSDKPDYEAINIVDIDESIVEMGAFQNDICVGAAVVDSGSAQILAYTEYANKDENELTFQVVAGRGDKQQVNSYYVYDFATAEYIKRKLIAGKQEYSIVRLSIGEDIPLPTKVSLSQNVPNPFGHNTTISYAIPEEAVVEIAIYNIRGQRVKALLKGKVPEGNHSIIWNGKDDNSKKLGNGIYFYKLSTGKNEIIKKMLLMMR